METLRGSHTMQISSSFYSVKNVNSYVVSWVGWEGHLFNWMVPTYSGHLMDHDNREIKKCQTGFSISNPPTSFPWENN